jgi:hypothetical protein
MIKPILRATLICSLVVGLFQGCLSPLSNHPKEVQPSDQLILGKKLQDPYTVESVRAALLSLINSNKTGLSKMSAASIDSIQILPNYLYVRFLPEGKIQEGLLQNYDTNLVMFPYPMDQEIIQMGHDYSLPDSVRVFYAAVPINYPFCPSVKYEILKELFLIEPTLDSLSTLSKKSASDPFITLLNTYGISSFELDKESLKLTGNLDARIKGMDTAGLTKTAWFSSGYRPTGTITYQDANLGVKPLIGARVTSGYWYTWTSSTTNASGYFRSGSTYTWGVDYHLHFDANDFEFQREFMVEGPTGKSSAWNINLTGKWAAVAIVFTAAYNYYYGNIDGLCRPHQNSWYNFKLDYEIFNEDYPADYTSRFGLGIYSSECIQIYLKDRANHAYLTPGKLYGFTTHETAHNAHYEHFQTRNALLPRHIEYLANIDDKVCESFSQGIEWYLTNKRYPGNRVDYFNIYTGIIEDLIDDDIFTSNRSDIGDYVQGFTIKQIENAFFESFMFVEVRDKLKSKYPSGSTTGLLYTITDYDNLFAYWRNK